MSDYLQRYVIALARGRTYIAVVLLGVLVTVLAYFQAADLRVRTDLSLLLPQHSPVIHRLNQVLDRLGTTGETVVEIRSSSPDANLRFMEAVAPRLEALPEVNFVLFHQDPAFFEERALLYLSTGKLKEIEKKVRNRIHKEVSRRLDLFGASDESSPASADADSASKSAAGGAHADAVAADTGIAAAADAHSDSDAAAAADTDAFLADDETRPWTGYRLDEYFVSKDGTVALMKVRPTGPPTDIEFSKRLLASLQRVLRSAEPARFAPDLSFSLRGDYADKVAEVESIKSDMAVASILCLVVIFLLLLAFFRQLRAGFLILVPLGMSAVWTLAFGRIVVGSLNVVSGFIVAILLGLGIDIGIHMYSRYLGERRLGRSVEEALIVTLRRTGRSVLTATVTTSVTFLTLVAADFQGFSEFGIMAGSGIVLCLLAMVTVFPALILLAENVRPAKVRHRPVRMYGRFTVQQQGRLGRVLAPALAAVLVVGGSAALFGAIVLPRIPFEFDFGKLTRKSAAREEKVRAEADLHQKGGQTYRDILDDATFPNAIALVDSLEEAKALHHTLDEVSERIDPVTGRPYLPRFLTVWHFVPDDQEAKLKIIRRIRRLVRRKIGLFKGKERERIERLSAYLDVDAPFGPDDLPDWVKKRFRERDGVHFGRFAMLWGWGHKEDYRTAARLYKAFGTLSIDGGKDVAVTANYFILKEVVDMAGSDGRRIMVFAVVAVLLILLADFRSLRKVALSAGTVLVGFLWMSGLLYIAGVKWSFFNLCILPTVVGMGIDDSVHFIHRYEEEGRGSVLKVIRTSGWPIVVTTLTTVAGFVGMLFADHYGLNSLGSVAVAGLLGTLLATLSMLPAYLLLEEFMAGRPRRQGRRS